MPDISMCEGIGCKDKLDCYRHMAPHDPHYQSFFTETPGTDKNCGYFWQDPNSGKLNETRLRSKHDAAKLQRD
jgi:hypothetical protein